MTSLKHILATNIKERRYVLGISQAKLAEAANIATAYIAMIEVEKKFPSVNVLERIAQALKIDPADLFSKTCYPVELVTEFHQLILKDIDQVKKNRIKEFKNKVTIENSEQKCLPNLFGKPSTA
jgi:transcriptional regulator with XRE-family HTH domain